MLIVTPIAGVWIEIHQSQEYAKQIDVTPIAGVWIEILVWDEKNPDQPSLPLRECGLKSDGIDEELPFNCHSHCGSVD